MILNKQVGMFLNLVHNRFKQYVTAIFDDHGFNITPEQFLVMDALWDEGVLSQQQIADYLLKDKNSVVKLVDGLEVKKQNLPEIRKKMGFVFQNSENQMFMPTVYEDMMFGPLNYGVKREEAEKKVDEVLARLHLQHLKHRHNYKLSGGELKMAAIATILAMEPQIILMDEPTASLDPENRRIVIDTIRSLDQTKIITSHDPEVIAEVCTRVIELKK